jgi:hypothetical protein
MTIYNGAVPTVSYYVQGGSPRVEALAQTLQYTDNELNLTNELQKLRLGIVVNEQTVDAVRTSQALGFGPISTPASATCDAPTDSALKRALIPGLAQEATPAMAFELINLREQVQTQLQAEMKKVGAAVVGQPPATQNVQPVAAVAVPPSEGLAGGAVASPQGVLQQPPTPSDSQALEHQVLVFQQHMREGIAQLGQVQAQRLRNFQG